MTFGRLTALTGGNGAGKTNLVGALVFALTGRTREGVRLDRVVRQGSAGTATVDLAFDHNGADCRVVRSTGGRRHVQLDVAGEPPVRGHADVADRLYRLLGVGEHLLLKYVFVDQWCMFDFLTGRDADRARAFAHLFGVDRAERIWEALRDVRPPTAAVGVDGPAVLARLAGSRRLAAEIAAEAALLRAELAALPPAEDDAGRYDRHLRAAAAAGLRASLTAEVDALRRALDEARRRAAEAEADLACVRDLVSGRCDACVDAAARRAARAEAASLARRAAEAGQRASAALLELAGLEAAEAPPPADYLAGPARAAAAARLADVSARLASFRRLADAFAGDADSAACPTCGTGVDAAGLAGRLDEARRFIPLLADEAGRLEGSLAGSADHDRRAELNARYLDGLRLAAAAAVDAAEAAGREAAAAAVGGDDAADAALLAEQATFEAGLADLAGDVRAATAAATAAADRLAAAEARLASLPPADGLLPDDELAALVAAGLRRGELSTVLAAMDGEVDRLTAAAAVDEGLAARFAAESAAAARAEALADRLSRVRDLFHRDRLPRLVSEHHLGRLAADVNAVLGEFDAGFRVDSVADLSPSVRFRDGRRMAAVALSGGEKVLLAMAVRIAVNSIYAGELGLLSLDEPTAGLSESNHLTCLRASLERLRRASRSRGLQVILITHEPSLSGLCDVVIDLDRPAGGPA